MKQRTQVNIIHDKKQLHYMVELRDTNVIEVTHGGYSYFSKAYEGVQFIRNKHLINNFENNQIQNVLRNLNTWIPEKRIFSNLYIPINVTQRKLTLYIPRYSMESFYDKDFGNDSEMNLSGIKYVITAYIYIAGIKVVLGSYLFDLGSARATQDKTRYKTDDYQLCVDFNILDPISITYGDEWAQFRQKICNEPAYINNTGSVIHINLDPVIESDTGGYYIRSSEFLGGISNIPFENKFVELFHANLKFNGDAIVRMLFNNVYNGDINLYLAETYGMWLKDDNGDIILIDREPQPLRHWFIFEVVIKDDENIYFCDTKLIKDYEDHEGQYPDFNPELMEYTFHKSEIAQQWTWYKDGLFIQGSVELYNVIDVAEDIRTKPDDEIIDYLRSSMIQTISLTTNEIPLNKENYKYLIPSNILPSGKNKINLKLVDMIEYEVSVVNKINKKVININRPEDYKANIVKPVFIRSEKLGEIVIHPAVNENISLNLNKYKSKVDIFYLRIEGIDFIEIGRTQQSVVFGIDGHLLPNEVTGGIAYLLDENFNLVTTGHYTYEQ